MDSMLAASVQINFSDSAAAQPNACVITLVNVTRIFKTQLCKQYARCKSAAPSLPLDGGGTEGEGGSMSKARDAKIPG
jgi:hypothetical protein